MSNKPFEIQVFEDLTFQQKGWIDVFLNDIGRSPVDWCNPSKEDYENTVFGIAAIRNFNNCPKNAASAWHLAGERADEAMQTFIYKEKSKIGEPVPRVTIEDFDGHWGNLKAFLDNLQQEAINVWKKTHNMHFPIHNNPHTHEAMRVQ